MRILVLTIDAFGGRGGIARFNQDFLRALSTYPQVTEVVAIPRRVVEPVGQLPDKVTYVTTGLDNKLKYSLVGLSTVLQKPTFDLLVCGHINLLPLAWLLQRQTQSLLYLVVHGIDAWQPSPNCLVNILLHQINGLISVSQLTQDRFLSWAKLNSIATHLLPNTVDLHHFTPGSKKVELVQKYDLEGKIVLLTLGRLDAKERYKGFDPVLEVLPTLQDKLPNLVYLIAGDGNDLSRLKAKAQALGLSNHVIFTGYVPETEKVDYYRLADVYVMPSKGEGFGIVFLEAMACGIPVIGSTVDGSREALRQGMIGSLVDPDDAQAIQTAILEALQKPKGIVPPGLDYFAYPSFEQRCHKILSHICLQNPNLSVI